MRKTLLGAGLVLLLVGAGVALIKRPHPPPAAVSTSQVAWQKGYETGYSSGRQSAAQGNDAPKDWLLHTTGLADAEKAQIPLDHEQFADGYEAGFRAGFKKFFVERDAPSSRL